MRIERFIKIIAGANFLKFENTKPEDFMVTEAEEAMAPITLDESMSELITARSKRTDIHNLEDDKSRNNNVVTLDDTIDVAADRNITREPAVLERKHESGLQTRTVKEGVDILKMDPS